MTTDVIYTTLAQIRAWQPCESGYRKLCKSLGGVRKHGKDTPVTFRQIYESNGHDDVLWCLRFVDKKWRPLLRHFACDCADDVRHLLSDERSIYALEVSRRYADGLATDEEMFTAKGAALHAAWEAAGTATFSEYEAANAAVWAAAGDYNSAADVAAVAAKNDIKEKQMNRLFLYCEKGERPK